MVVPELAARDNSDELASALISRGATIVGFADLGKIKHDLRMDLPFGISIMAAFSKDIVARIVGGPTVEYYAEDRRVRDLLDSLGTFTADYLTQRGHRAVALTERNVKIDRQTRSTRLPHKTAATRAGLGWIGKTAMLVTPSFGLAASLTTVLTDARFPAGKPIDTSRCGDCRACVDICPARAAKGLNWRSGMERDAFFDASACRSAGIDLAAKIGIADNCCGMCVAACPWTQAYIRRSK